MVAIGITGHQRIPAGALEYVTRGIRDSIKARERPLVGYSSLAIGADQLFAEQVLAEGGDVIAVIPCRGYEHTFGEDDLVAYESLLRRCLRIVVLNYPEPTDDAFMAAGKKVVSCSDAVIAVWDGAPAAGLGGTADVVAHARGLGKEVLVVWPRGVRR